MSENDIFSRWFGSEYDMYNRMKDQASHRGYDKSYERERPSDMEYENERLKELERERMEEIYERQRARDAMLRRRNNQRVETEDGPACKRETSCEDISWRSTRAPSSSTSTASTWAAKTVALAT